MRIDHEIERLVWDDWNREHIRKHGVTLEDAEDVVSGLPTFEETYKGRLKAVGPTTTGRMVVVIIGSVPGRVGDYYVFSSRPASRNECRQYDREMKGAGT